MSSAKKRAPLCAFLAFLIAWPGGAKSRGTAPPGSPVRTRQELAQKILKVDNLFAAEFDKEHAEYALYGVASALRRPSSHIAATRKLESDDGRCEPRHLAYGRLA